jgi:hypothetical protein
LRHRYFQVATDLILTQKELASLNPAFGYLPNSDLSPIFTKIIKAIARTTKQANNFQILVC